MFKSHSGKAKLQSQDGGGSYDFYGYTDSCQVKFQAKIQST